MLSCRKSPYAILNDDDFRGFIFELKLMVIAGSMVRN